MGCGASTQHGGAQRQQHWGAHPQQGASLQPLQSPQQPTEPKQPTWPVEGIDVAAAGYCKFSGICSLGKSQVCLAPADAPKMVIYDIVTGLTTSVEVAETAGCQPTDRSKFGGVATLGEGMVCLAPWNAKKMVLYDVGSKKVQAVEVCHAAGCEESTLDKFHGICAVGENVLVLAPHSGAKKMVVYDVLTRKATGVDVATAAGCSETARSKFWGVCAHGDQVFLAPADAPKMVIYDIVTGLTTSVEVAEAAGCRPTDSWKFGGVAAVGEGMVCLAPWSSARKMVLYDVGSKQVQAVEVCHAAGCDESANSKFMGICAVGENVLVLAPRSGAKKMVVYDVLTRKATGVDVATAAGCSETAGEKFWGVCAHGFEVYLAPFDAAKMVKCTDPRKLRQATKDLLLAATSGEKTLESQREAFQKEQEEEVKAAEASLQKEQEAELTRLKRKHQEEVKEVEPKHQEEAKKLEAKHQKEAKELEEKTAVIRKRHEEEMKAFDEQQARVREALRKQSEESGISATYVCHHFATEVREVLPASQDPDPNFRTIRKYLMERPDGKPGKGEETVCPRDGKMGCSFMDAEVPAHRAKATHFVSWCWGYSMDQFASAVQGHFRSKNEDLSSIFLWICFHCNNQYRIFRDQTMTGTGALSAAFESHLVAAGRMLVMLDDFMQPQYITRVWCIFEMYVSIDRDIPHEVILPEAAQSRFADARIPARQLRAHFLSLDVRNATASSKDDESVIKDTIEQKIGFDKVNTQVRDNLSKWVVDAFTKAILG